MAKKNTRLDELLNYSNRPYRIREQKAELLLRNTTFQKDLAQVRIHFAYKNRADDIVRASDKKKTKDVTRAELRLGARDKTAGSKWFYEKWDIDTLWDGQKATLHEHIRAGPGVWIFPPLELMAKLHARDGIPVEFSRYQRALPLDGPAIFITVDPWTTQKSILSACRYVNQKRKRLFGFSRELKSLFARDLCWYDLQKDLNLSSAKIAKEWAKRRHDEFMALVRKTKDWKSASREGNDAAVSDYLNDYPEDYLASGLPSVVSAAINRLQQTIDCLTR